MTWGEVRKKVKPSREKREDSLALLRRIESRSFSGL